MDPLFSLLSRYIRLPQRRPSQKPPAPANGSRSRQRTKLCVEALEDRTVPSTLVFSPPITGQESYNYSYGGTSFSGSPVSGSNMASSPQGLGSVEYSPNAATAATLMAFASENYFTGTYDFTVQSNVKYDSSVFPVWSGTFQGQATAQISISAVITAGPGENKGDGVLVYSSYSIYTLSGGATLNATIGANPFANGHFKARIGNTITMAFDSSSASDGSVKSGTGPTPSSSWGDYDLTLTDLLKPTINTVAGGTVTLGSGNNLTDTATVSGGNNPTGTITFTLTNNGSTVDTETTAVNGDGTYSTPNGYLPTAAGSYTWSASYSGDSNNDSATDNGQNESETVVSLPDLAVNFLQWNPGNGGAKYQYQINGGDLSVNPTIEVFWNTSPLGAPIYSQTLSGAQGNGTPGFITPAQLGIPPAGAAGLLLQVFDDQGNPLQDANLSNNSATLAYSPSVTVSATYNGNADATTIGRFFSGIPLVEPFTVTLNQDLAAVIGPNSTGVTLDVGSVPPITATANSATQYLASYDVSQLSGDTALSVNVSENGRVLASAPNATLHVDPLPSWLSASTGIFDYSSSSYQFNNVTLGANVKVPTLPIDFEPLQKVLARLSSSASVVASLNITAPLDVNSTVTWSGQKVTGKAVVLGSTVWDETYDSDDLLVGGTLTSETLNPNGFYVKLANPEQLPDATFFNQNITVPIFNGPVTFNIGLKVLVTGTLTADAGVQINTSGNSVVFVPDGTFITLTPTLTTQITASFPVTVGKWTLLTPYFTSDIALTVIVTGHWGGALTSPDLSSYTLKGTLAGDYDYGFAFGELYLTRPRVRHRRILET
jgi:hypothetical protein